MKATGIVVEYNPFHNGHLLHATESRKITGNDVLIAVMSGPFLQRGEPALVSKWERTRMALSAGVDVVIELPYAFATQHASNFALGAVTLLDAIGCEALCFGSEDGKEDTFIERIHWKNNNQDALDSQIKEFMKKGYSYPSSVAKSYEHLTTGLQALDLSQPNNMLGLQYVEAIKKQARTIKPYTILRKSSGYHEATLHTGKISSATSIRKAIFDGSLEKIKEHVPTSTYLQLQQYINTYHQFHQWENYWQLLQHLLITHSPLELREIYEIEEGIEYRLIEHARTSTSFHSFMKKVKTKRYTWTRIQRMLIHVLTHTKKEEIIDNPTPTYLRLLGMTQRGRAYLNAQKKNFSLPLISKVGRTEDPLLSTDLRAGFVYAMGIQNTSLQQQLMQADYTNPPIILP
ncbi:nucleotidyltransferase [Jeotgalibacillus marinus]|uniref:tRNA(Met) cytidine acetate ligase n=1 Tax=Jeotgalibacillus marinus TaxID=86667 RepID=A0ABV3Q234_9BACL